MPNFIVYAQNGEIIRTGNCPLSMIGLQMDIDNFVMEGEANDVAQYIDIATLTVADKMLQASVIDKLEMVADGVDTTTITGLPIPCIVAIDGLEYNVDDGIFEFTVDLPGIYRITVKAPAYLLYETKVTAT